MTGVRFRLLFPVMKSAVDVFISPLNFKLLKKVTTEGNVLVPLHRGVNVQLCHK